MGDWITKNLYWSRMFWIQTAVALTMCYNYSCASPKSAADVIVKITADVCSELADAGAAPDWVLLACQIEGGIVKVLLPRQQWASIRAMKSLKDGGAQ